MNIFRKYGYAWATLALFVFSLIGHWTAGWYEYAEEQRTHGEKAEVNNYVVKMTRGTLENWKSEFLQLLWQVGGLAFLFYVGSPQSKEGDDRKEEKLDAILSKVDPRNGKRIISELDRKYPKK